MNLIGSLLIAFSMYSSIPMPQVTWTKERMKYAMCFFPLIGAVIGAAVVVVYGICMRFGFSSLGKMLPVAVPLVLTGGIHMDGFLDVTDARASHAEKERKLEILKDPHTGAFAIIGCSAYVIVYAAAWGDLKPWMVVPAAGIFVMARALSGLSVVLFPKAKNSGLAAMFSGQADKRAVAAAMTGYFVAAEAFIWYTGGTVAAVALTAVAAAVYAYYYGMSKKEFGGITGDLAGYFLQVCELAMILGLTIVSHLAG